MKKINIRRTWYSFRHKYLTLNSAIIFIAFLIACGWVWGSLQMMQRNYNLQRELDEKNRQLLVAQLDTANAQLQQAYYKTDEYKELAVRQNLGLVKPGESVLILPDNSDAVKQASSQESASIYSTTDLVTQDGEKSNFKQWVNFLFGINIQNLDI